MGGENRSGGRGRGVLSYEGRGRGVNHGARLSPEPEHSLEAQAGGRGIFGWTRSSSLQVRRFAAVGVLNTVVDYVVFVGLTKMMRLSLDSVWVAKAMSGTVAISMSFYLNRTWVFRVSGARLGQAARFLTTTLVGVYLIQTPLTHVFSSWYPNVGKELYKMLARLSLTDAFPSVLTEALAIKSVAFALATFLSMAFNYGLYRFWVFRIRELT